MKGLEVAKAQIQNGADGYDGYMDKECVAICDALNALPGVETIESCCGHFKNSYRIWFGSVNPYSLAIIARVFDRRYSGTNLVYRVCMITRDAEVYPQYTYMIESVAPYSSQKEMEEDIAAILDNFKHWQNPCFDEYFGKDNTTSINFKPIYKPSDSLK